MKPFLWLTFLLLLSSPAFAACTGSSPNWDCPATGTPAQNGQDLWDLLNNLTISCGDTITVHPGQYNTFLSGGLNFALRLKAQAGCGSNKTQIVASNLASFPAGTRVGLSNCASMPQILGAQPTGDGSLFVYFYGTGVNKWAFRGVCFSTQSTSATSGSPATTGVDGGAVVGATTPLSDLQSDIEFDRVVLTTYEELTYGSQATCTVQACFFRSLGMGMNLGGQRISVHDSYIQSGTFNPSSPNTCAVTAATNAAPAVITCAGIAASFGMSNVSGCTTGPTIDCFSNGGTRIAVFEGATGSWTGLNGAKWLVYQSANSVAVYKGESFAYYDPHPFDSTSLGALTGTISVRAAIPTEPTYVIVMASACVDCSFVNNTFEYGQMTVFTGGGIWQPGASFGTIQSGSTATSIVLASPPSNLSVGDLVSIPVTTPFPGSSIALTNGSPNIVGTGTNFNASMVGKIMTVDDNSGNGYNQAYTVASVTDATHAAFTTNWAQGTMSGRPWLMVPTWCNYPNAKGCWHVPNRVGHVTGISGSTITVEAWGPNGSDLTPLTGATAIWNGRQIENLELRRNTIKRPDSMPSTGKGFIEIKDCRYCLIDGNILTDSPTGNWFLTTRNQGGNTPWNNGSHIYFSNNLVGGPNGAPKRMTLQGEDDEMTSTKSDTVYFLNNILPEVHFMNGSTASPLSTDPITDGGHGFINGAGWIHNTALAKTGVYQHKGYGQGACTTPPTTPNNYQFSTGTALRDNVMSYGESVDATSCLTDQATQFKYNLFWADGSVSPSTIISTWPQNNAESVIGNLGLIGTCTFANYTNCGVANGTTYAGTASDGGNPGADVLQVKDRINAYSETAGLLVVDMTLPAMVNNPAAFSRNSTTTSMTFTIQGTVAGNCSLKLYTDINRATLAADTNTSGKQACNRSGNTINGKTVTFALGSQNALTPNTSYYYDIEVTDSGETMVGTFATLATGGTTRTGKVVVSGSAVIR